MRSTPTASTFDFSRQMFAGRPLCSTASWSLPSSAAVRSASTVSALSGRAVSAEHLVAQPDLGVNDY
eukprot:5557087-Amphidinium_carterae.1